jgi:glycosyltransferase involved in cell wall biosynthesis
MRLVFVYPKRFSIYPPDYLERGVGGTESLFITLTRELAKLGHEVTVYANAYKEGVYDGVEWRSIWRTSEDKSLYDFRVILRYPEAFDYPLNVRKTILWSHDNFYDESRIKQLVKENLLDQIVVVSNYHKKITKKALQMPDYMIVEIPNSFDNYLYSKFGDVRKERFKCIYCSVPIRGLSYLVTMWDKLSQILPEARLYITSDLTLWGSSKQDDMHVMNELYKKIALRNNIYRLGSIPKEEVAYHQATSELMIYPTDFDELFCISALECLSVGTPFVTSNRAGLVERKNGNNGTLIRGEPSTQKYQGNFLEATLGYLKDRDKLSKAQIAARESASNYSIDKVVLLWDNLFNKK